MEKNSQPSIDANSVFENAVAYVAERVDVKGGAQARGGPSRKWKRQREESEEVVLWHGGMGGAF